MKLTALVLPVVGLGGLWGWTDYLSRQGTEWDVAIEGYDPRDLLRGHYVQFTYDWPEPPEEGDDAADEEWRFEPGPRLLCLYGDAPRLDRAVRIKEEEFEACAHPARANPASVYGYSSLERGRFYVNQDRALEIEKELRNPDQRGVVRFRQRDDGTITPISIRFRSLTEDEIAERDSDDQSDVAPAEIELMMAPSSESED
ncbi:MAG: GDYXXLXY domain-containing protein [Pseudomonadota bacterium]